MQTSQRFRHRGPRQRPRGAMRGMAVLLAVAGVVALGWVAVQLYVLAVTAD
ncbi:hypothetical protein LJR175_006849 [Variovorax sp. LjRoot175]|uniref:hypothetical protein n=1 Tax=Variovorax sp. LjRoot175 TaxID=3342276 RepID=UPI003ED12D4B